MTQLLDQLCQSWHVFHIIHDESCGIGTCFPCTGALVLKLNQPQDREYNLIERIHTQVSICRCVIPVCLAIAALSAVDGFGLEKNEYSRRLVYAWNLIRELTARRGASTHLLETQGFMHISIGCTSDIPQGNFSELRYFFYVARQYYPMEFHPREDIMRGHSTIEEFVIVG
jgi:hypothetical protein